MSTQEQNIANKNNEFYLQNVFKQSSKVSYFNETNKKTTPQI